MLFQIVGFRLVSHNYLNQTISLAFHILFIIIIIIKWTIQVKVHSFLYEQFYKNNKAEGKI